MADQQASSPSSQPNRDWREARRAERRERLTQRYGWIGPGVGGFILILMGLIFLAQNFGYPVPDSWWTIFLLIPAGGAYYAAWKTYSADGKLNGETLAALVGGITLTALAMAFLFNFSWGLLWPLVLVAVGCGILLRTYWH
jgi:hypothetical protein